MANALDALFAATAAPMVTRMFGETVTRYPRGVVAEAQAVANVYVDLGAELGTNEVSGDGVVPDDSKGERVRRSAYLEVPASQETHVDDAWLVRSEVWQARRIVARDAGRVRWLIVQTITEGGTTLPRLRGQGRRSMR